MNYLTNELLKEIYFKAKYVKVNDDFIKLLEEEINRRCLSLEDNEKHKEDIK